MVISRLVGGLGNQLFQFAVGRHLSLIHGCSLRLDRTAFRHYKLHEYGLAAFCLDDRPPRSIDRLVFRGLVPRVGRRVGGGGSVRIGRFTYLRESDLRFDAAVLQTRGHVYLDGYWQSERYFSAISDVLREDLRLSSPPVTRALTVRDLMTAQESVSVHVRLGDFAADAKTRRVHGVLDSSYYRRASRTLMAELPDAVFFLFSDDPGEAKKIADLPPERTVVVRDHAPGLSDAEELWLMSTCRHHVIGNSTFSWWGAWLGEPGGQTIAPLRWFADPSRDSRDIVPSRWRRM